MKRRDFIKSLSIIPVITSLPVLAREVAPKTADELYRAINSLGTVFPQRSMKAYEEILPVSREEFLRKGIIRYTHRVYALGSKTLSDNTEAKLVGRIWMEMKEFFKQHPAMSPTVVWRKLPAFVVNENILPEDHWAYDSCKAKIIMRLSIGHNAEQPNFIPFSHKPEGGDVAILG